MDNRVVGVRVFKLLIAICVGLIAADFFYQKYGHYAFETWFGFHGFYGFVSCVALVLAAKELRKILMRDDDYYD